MKTKHLTMNLMSQILATEPGEISGSKWINVRPHPSPLPQGEGEIVAVCWRSEGTEFAPVQGFNARMFRGNLTPALSPSRFRIGTGRGVLADGHHAPSVLIN